MTSIKDAIVAAFEQGTLKGPAEADLSMNLAIVQAVQRSGHVRTTLARRLVDEMEEALMRGSLSADQEQEFSRRMILDFRERKTAPSFE